MKKVSFILGTRPEAIKLAPVILGMRMRSDLQVNVCITGQHREMLDQVLGIFGIKPDIDLDLMCPDQKLPNLTARAIEAPSEYLLGTAPDLVLVQGDLQDYGDYLGHRRRSAAVLADCDASAK